MHIDRFLFNIDIFNKHAHWRECILKTRVSVDTEKNLCGLKKETSKEGMTLREDFISCKYL